MRYGKNAYDGLLYVDAQSYAHSVRVPQVKTAVLQAGDLHGTLAW